ncbi:aminoimidazole riboside kinase [Alteribacter natronophilus]|uniref:aminoimidazole riboside kinase n=1 Tax=Alteribacter natronophilus TaxID=2583810 RepID=UPI00110DE818|nr:aminoimidazole riboside kinase [Alteribacter natronophilus]TMW72097.1 aminoimidazole riboside kinase [Alteribacter natronophilus]
MKKGIVCLGEALIDFIPLDSDNKSFHKSPGGAPANVAVGAAQLGAHTSFIGKVGEDVLGRFLKETLDGYRVHTDRMFFSQDVRTGVVFVTLDAAGERSFDFYIDPSADRFLEEDEVDDNLFEEHNLLHFGSISLISEPARSATKKAVRLARDKGAIVSYDPNLRMMLWDSEEAAREQIVSMLGEADVVKISEEELEFITGEKEIESGVQALASYNIPLLLVTMGGEGSHVFAGGNHIHVPAMKVDAVDTTGAGDAFVSGMLYQLHISEKPVDSLTAEEAGRMAEFASVSGALAASTKGAMTALPTLEQVNGILNENGGV